MNKDELLNRVEKFISETIDDFHKRRLEKLKNLNLNTVLIRKNPYLYKAKGLEKAFDIVESIVSHYIASQEETIFGEWLESLAIFVCGLSFGGVKSSTQGIDLEFEREGFRYFVSIKSGPNWGNSSQIRAMVRDFESIRRRLTQKELNRSVFVEGCCYGRCGIRNKGIYYKYCGKDFWELISGIESFYIDIVEPIGYKAREKNQTYITEYNKLINRLAKEFMADFCEQDGSINWQKLLSFNSCASKGG